MENQSDLQNNIELTPEQKTAKKKGKFAIAGFVLSLVGMFLIPLLGSILGIIFSAMGVKSNNRGFAIAGIVLGIIPLVLILILIPIVFTSLGSAQLKAKTAAYQAEVRAGAASLMLACDDGSLAGATIWSKYSRNVNWDQANIVSDNCSNQMKEFLVTDIKPLEFDVMCSAEIDNTETRLDCQ